MKICKICKTKLLLRAQDNLTVCNDIYFVLREKDIIVKNTNTA